MSSAIESQLNETFRDALVGYYLSEVVPNHVPIKEMGLSGKLKTANDLFEFLLLDVQVSQAVDTSYVASAISSIQQYINAVLMGMEPGYTDQVLNANQLAEWRDQRSQYPIWAANQKLLYYPELYIDPTLRMQKSGYFQQLETDINQNKIELDTVQEAVNAYLASFEEVANLSVINGYIDSNDFATGTYYFIGKSRAEQQYYWRRVDMNDRPYVNGRDGPKSDYPNPGAWSDWKKANIGITPNALEHTIRPAYFNNRLFVTWVDRTVITEMSGDMRSGELGLTSVSAVKVAMYASYKKYDGTWSAPHAYIQETLTGALMTGRIDSVAVFDNSHSPEGLFLATYIKKDNNGNYDFRSLCLVDKNFNAQTLTDDGKGAASTVLAIFATTNYDRIQFQVDPSVGVEVVREVPTPGSDNFDYDGVKSVIDTIDDANLTYDINDASVSLKVSINAPGIKPDVHVLTFIYNMVYAVNAQFTVVLDVSNVTQTSGWAGLDDKSYIDAVSFLYPLGFGCWFTFLNNQFLFEAPDGSNYVGVHGTGRTSLSGFKVNLAYFAKADCYPVLSNERNEYSSIIGFRGSALTLFKWWFGYASTLSNFSSASLTCTSSSPPTSTLPPGTSQSLQVRTDRETGLPLSGYLPSSNGTFHVLYGLEAIQNEGSSPLGRALRCVELKVLPAPPSVDRFIAPKVSLTTNGGAGVAEYINFAGSSIELGDNSTTATRKPIRMNTLFARELINKASIALENLLSWETQQLAEPALPSESMPRMDFHGANGLYFWELFFHLPLMVAQRLNLERQFDGSDQWLGFIFDPSRKTDATGRPDYWNVRPLEEESVRDYAMRMPVDPDGMASSNPIIYKKATYGYYIKNLIDRGDAAYRQLTPDSLTEAKLWYVRVLDLLGPRPDALLLNEWAPKSLADLQEASSPALRMFEEKLIDQSEHHQASATENDGVSQLHFREQPLRLSTYAVDPMSAEVDNPYFRVPLNAELVKHWDTVESRLYNLRHNLTLDGKTMSLPLFAAPLDPRGLLAAFANGGVGGGLAAVAGQEVGHYRFTTMYNHASAAVETLIQFGSTLLSLIERKEASELQEVQQHQLWSLAQYTVDLQKQTQKLEAENRKAVLASQKIADQRALFYYQLADEGVSAGETAAIALHSTAKIIGSGASISSGLAILAQPERMIGGFSVGNFHIAVPTLQSVAVAGEAASNLNALTADSLDRSEGYRRRQEDWEHARDQARLESEQIDAQLKVLDEQASLTAFQLGQAELVYNQARTNYEFLGKRFTQSQLYEWLNGQMSSFYYQAYDATMSLCLAAEASWQFERADFTTRFVRPSAWNGSRRGLLAGESLKLDLLKMNTAYLTRNERLLEIVKTVSVRQLPVSTEDVPTLNTDWDTVLTRLKGEGVAEFELTKAMLDDDYPNHYLRRIKRISVSLPVTVGPYQDIRAILTQTYSAVHLAPGADVPPRENLRASQQIAVSTGVDDDGLFVFNFDDERYLPFEGTGVISRWTLEFPNPEGQLKMIESITDIIVHVRYTARSGGSVMTRSEPARVSKARVNKNQ